MSKQIPLRKQRSISFHNPQDEKEKKNKPFHASKLRKKIFHKHHPVSRAYKKLSPCKIKKETPFSRKLRRLMNQDHEPHTPHNTTQYIVDSVYFPTDPYMYEFDTTKPDYAFHQHAMAGSMMDLMQQRLFKNSSEEKESPMEEEKENKGLEVATEIPKLRMVKSADDTASFVSEVETCADKDYENYLKDFGNGKNVQDVIKQLVSVIKKKDDQINTLLSNQHKIEQN